MTLACVVLVTTFTAFGIAVKAAERGLIAHEARRAIVADMLARMGA